MYRNEIQGRFPAPYDPVYGSGEYRFKVGDVGKCTKVAVYKEGVEVRITGRYRENGYPYYSASNMDGTGSFVMRDKDLQ